MSLSMMPEQGLGTVSIDKSPSFSTMDKAGQDYEYDTVLNNKTHSFTFRTMDRANSVFLS